MSHVLCKNIEVKLRLQLRQAQSCNGLSPTRRSAGWPNCSRRASTSKVLRTKISRISALQ